MFVVSAGLEESEAVQVPDGLDYGLPCAFAGCSGFFHPAGGATGIVLCSPWGYEDLAMRKSWRLLAEAVAKAGYPCLRFDYPGTGNSLGAATDPSSVDAWIAAIGAAADLVRRTSGVKRFVFIGQSLGAALAVEAARRRGDVVGLHLIAPVVKGRAHVRELAATSRMVAEKLGIEPDVTDADALSVVGFALAPAMVASLKALDLLKLESLGVEHVVIYDQSDRKAAVEALEQFRRLGADVALEPLAPYHLMVSDATIIQPLPVEADRLIEIVRARHPLARPAGDPVLPPLAGVMLGPTFREEPIRFGPQQALYGVLCRRIGARADQPAVILLNRGLNPHVGWRRISVDHARRLADAGITSLRIDVAGLGESRDEPGRPQNLIYSDLLVPDIRAAVDALVARGHSRIVLAGVCSGAYMALAAAHADPRVTDVVAVNAQRFLWNPKESFEDVIRFGLRSIDDYVGDLKSGGALRKLLRSRRRILPAMAFLTRRYAKHAMARVPLHLRSRLMRDSMEARVAQFFFDLEAQRTRIALVFSAGDPGLVELRNYFGPDGRDMPHANVTISIVPDADHNLTTNAACDRLLAHILDAVNAGPSAEPPRPASRPAPASSRRAAYST